MSDCYGDYLRSIGRIPLLTPSEELHLGALVQRWRNNPAPEPAEEHRGRRAFVRMVTANLRLVVSLCKHQHRRIRQQNVEPMDLVQAGNLGLITAVERYLPERGYRFSTYGTWWIRQAVNRHLQVTAGLIRMPPQMAGLARKVHALRGASPRALSLAELGRLFGESEWRLQTVLLASHHFQILSLDRPMGTGDGEVRLADLIGDRNERGLQDDDQWLHGEVSQLTSLERQVLGLRYFHDEPLSLVGAAESIGLPKYRVQHLERMALRKLRHRLAPGMGLHTKQP